MNDSNYPIYGRIVSSIRDVYQIEVETKAGPKVITGKPSGKIRLNKINLMVGDYVEVMVSVNDSSHGLIQIRMNERQYKNKVFNLNK